MNDHLDDDLGPQAGHRLEALAGAGAARGAGAVLAGARTAVRHHRRRRNAVVGAGVAFGSTLGVLAVGGGGGDDAPVQVDTAEQASTTQADPTTTAPDPDTTASTDPGEEGSSETTAPTAPAAEGTTTTTVGLDPAGDPPPNPTVPPAPATTVPPPSVTLPPPTIEDEDPAALDRHDAAAALQADLDRRFPDTFAGLWWVGTDLHISAVDGDPALEQHARDFMAGQANAPTLTFHEATWSWKELRALTNAISQDKDELLAEGIELTSWGPDIIANRVSIRIYVYDATRAAALQDRYGADRVTVSQGDRVVPA